MRFFYGFIGIIVGFLLIRYSILLTETLGRMDWAEQYLKGGLAGTYSMYRLLGLIFIIFSLLYIFNIFGFIVSPLAPLFGAGK
ncbi:MAG: hypothetical protein KW802_01475 [Candidatus Doudnabacteria bacterium]|nr:hypothetical protein [Candidatus Doudnabacteria bacterium]